MICRSDRRAAGAEKRRCFKTGNNFDRRNYSERISTLTERAKNGSNYIADLNIGESCYLLSLITQIQAFRIKQLTTNELFHKQKELERQLEKYYQQQEINDLHIYIRNHYSHILTEAEKQGCPICKKLVRIFDGRE